MSGTGDQGRETGLRPLADMVMENARGLGEARSSRYKALVLGIRMDIRARSVYPFGRKGTCRIRIPVPAGALSRRMRIHKSQRHD